MIREEESPAVICGFFAVGLRVASEAFGTSGGVIMHAPSV
jgi:hypothetical protein